MALIYGGLLYYFQGVIGPLWGKTSSTGKHVVVPRYRNDAKSPAQLEQRRRLAMLSRIGSKLYLPMLKPYEYYYKQKYTALACFIDNCLSDWYAWEDMPYMWLFARNLASSYWYRADYISPTVPLQVTWSSSPYVSFVETDTVRFFLVVGQDKRVFYDDGSLTWSTGRWVPPKFAYERYEISWLYGVVMRRNYQGNLLPLNQAGMHYVLY